MDPSSLLFIVVLLFSVIVHELAHGYTAEYLGDITPRMQGRLTLNPIPHLDMLGSIILPGFLVLTGSSFLFGWAKPVEYNPYNLRNGRLGEFFVAFAGPLSNIIIAVIFGLLLRFSIVSGEIFFVIVVLNLLLAVINLIPFPPLDGATVFGYFVKDSIKDRLMSKFSLLFSNQILLLLVAFSVIFFFFKYITLLVLTLAYFITGLG